MSVQPQISTSTHIFISIAAACFAYLFLIYPSTKILNGNKYSLIVGTILIYSIIIPIIMLYNGSIETNISGQNLFVSLKFISVAVFVIIMTLFLIKNTNGNLDYYMSIILTGILCINILEAVVEQFYTSINNDQNIPIENNINVAGSVIGIILIIVLLYKHNKMSVSRDNSQLKLVSNISIMFAVAYTFWNLLFRIQLIPNTSVFIFFIVSLLLPLFCMITNTGDWLQIRALTLLLVMILTFGIGKNNYSIMPMYNKQGYNQELDDNDPISIFIKNENFKIFLIVMAFITSILSFKY